MEYTISAEYMAVKAKPKVPHIVVLFDRRAFSHAVNVKMETTMITIMLTGGNPFSGEMIGNAKWSTEITIKLKTMANILLQTGVCK